MGRRLIGSAVTAALLALCTGSLTNTAMAQPAELCVNAGVVVVDTPYVVNFVGSTADTGASSSCQSSTVGDFWATFTPATTGTFRFSTCAAGAVDTVLSVHTNSCPGTSVNQLSGGCNDDSACTTLSTASILDLPLTSGTTYLVRIARYGLGANGSGTGTPTFQITAITSGACCNNTTGNCTITLNTACASPSVYTANIGCSPYPCIAPGTPPANNLCENAEVISGPLPISVSGTNVAATGEGQGSCGTATSATRDVFYSFTPATTGIYALSLCSSSVAWDSVITVHTSCGATAANQVASGCNDTASPSCSSPNTSHARLNGVALTGGVAYIVRVTGSTTTAANAFTLFVESTASGACCRTNGDCTFETSAFSCVTPNTFVANAACSPYSCTQPAGAPANNLCESAQVILATASNNVLGTLVNASAEGFDSCGTTLRPAGKDIFYSFTPTITGNYRVQSCLGATATDTTMSVHSACPATSTNQIACSDQGCTTGNLSRITSVPMTAGLTYIIRLAGFANTTTIAAGSATRVDIDVLGSCCAANGTCSVTAASECLSPSTFSAGGGCTPNICPQPPAPANDLCINAATVPGAGGSVTSTLLGANSEGIVSVSGCGNAAGRDIYFSFTPADSGAYRLSTCNSTSQDTVISVHTACPTSSAFNNADTAANACNDAGGCTGALARLNTGFVLNAGTTYIIRVAIATATTTGDGIGGSVRLDVTRLGTCCRPEGSCSQTISTDCVGPGSSFTAGQICSPNPCTPPAVPANDLCANAAVIDTTGGEPFTVSGTVAGATPTSIGGGCGATAGLDVFYSFTPTATGEWAFSLCSSSLNWASAVSVHTACPSGTTNIISGSCSTAFCGSLSRSRITLTAGTTYFVRVSTNLATPLANYGPFSMVISRTGACCTPSGASQGTCVVQDAASCIGAGVFQGPGTVCTPNSCPTSGACCTASTGFCYPSFSGTCASGGTFSSGVTCTASACGAVPANATCATALPLALGTAYIGSNATSTVSSNTAADGPANCSNTGAVSSTGFSRPVWFTFTPTATANYDVSSCATTFDSVISVFTGSCSSIGSLVSIGCNDDVGSGTNFGNLSGTCTGVPVLPSLQAAASSVSYVQNVRMNAGTTYLIRFSAYNTFSAGGNYRLLVSFNNAAAIGSCCVTTSCSLGDAAACSSGTFTLGGACSPNPCVPATVVCCRGSTCSIVAAAACTTTGFGAGALPLAGSTCNASGVNTTPCCHADYNKNGTVAGDVPDIFAFLADWFANSPYAFFGGDGTGSGSPGVPAIFSFLAAWFAGCP